MKYMPQNRRALAAFAIVQCRGHAARQATAMPMGIGGAQGLLWDLQCELRVGVIWGRRHLRVALGIVLVYLLQLHCLSFPLLPAALSPRGNWQIATAMASSLYCHAARRSRGQEVYLSSCMP